MSNDPVVAIVGVTGAVGAEFIATMDRRGFAVGRLKALASARSAGKTVQFRGKPVVIEELTERAFEGVDIALFSAGGSISRKFAPVAVQAGAVVIDNSSAFRMDPNVPLVIPEINARPHPRPQGHHRQPQLRGDHRAGAAVADPPQEPHQARDHLDLPGRQRRRRGRHGGAGAIDPCPSQGPGFYAKGAAASLCLQPVQPQHHDRSRDRLQRRGDQGHQGDPQDLRGRAYRRRRDLRARAGAARPLRGHHLRMREADHRGSRSAPSWPKRLA